MLLLCVLSQIFLEIESTGSADRIQVVIHGMPKCREFKITGRAKEVINYHQLKMQNSQSANRY